MFVGGLWFAFFYSCVCGLLASVLSWLCMVVWLSRCSRCSFVVEVSLW